LSELQADEPSARPNEAEGINERVITPEAHGGLREAFRSPGNPLLPVQLFNQHFRTKADTGLGNVIGPYHRSTHITGENRQQT